MVFTFFSRFSLMCVFVFFSSVSAYAGFGFDGRIENKNSKPLPAVESTVNSTALPLRPMPSSVERDSVEKERPVLQIYSKNGTMPHTILQHPPQHPSMSPDFKYVDVETWKADQGEPLKDVIARWSERAHVDLVWGIEDRRTILDSVSYFGNFEGALTHLFDVGMQGTVEGALNYTDMSADEAEKVEERFSSAPVAPVRSFTPQNSIKKTTPSMKPSLIKPSLAQEERKWKATRDESLKDTLTQWQSAGEYELIWDYPFDIVMPNDFFAYGQVEEALVVLLDQFSGGENRTNMRPVGDLYQDPVSAIRYLHIKRSL